MNAATRATVRLVPYASTFSPACRTHLQHQRTAYLYRHHYTTFAHPEVVPFSSAFLDVSRDLHWKTLARCATLNLH